MIVITVVLAVLVSLSVPASGGSQHCGDRIRSLVLDSCRQISQAYRQKHQQAFGMSTSGTIVKRENEVEPEFVVEYLNESKYDAWQHLHAKI